MAFLEIIIALFTGVFIGIITGLTPGIHVNLVSVMLLSLAPVLLQVTSPVALAVFIISLAITHTFLDSLPSIYLGAPDESQALNVLPGHRLLMKGEGHNAVVYTVIGSLGVLLVCLLLFPLLLAGMKIINPFIKGIMGYLLAVIMLYMISREKGKRLKSAVIFLLAGTLGLIVLNGIHSLRQPLLPLLSGLFGVSILLLSWWQKSKIPKQDFSKPLTLSTKNMVKSVGAASGMGFISAFLPGFGNAQAAIVGTSIVGDIGDEGFLSLVGGINTASMVVSIGTAYALEKARNGAIVAVYELLGSIDFQQMLVFLGVALAVGGIAALLTIYFSKVFAKYIVKVDYSSLIISIIGFIIALTFYFDGFIGLIILMTATALGVMASSWNVGKNHLMGCLIVPVILFFVL